MNTVALAKLDEVAASLIRAYQREGVPFSTFIRPADKDGDVRVIAPQLDVSIISEFLHHTAEVLFNGPATIRYPKA